MSRRGETPVNPLVIESITPSLPWGYASEVGTLKMSAEVTIDDVLAHLHVVTEEDGAATLSYNSATSKIGVYAGTLQIPHWTITVNGDTLTFQHEDLDADHISSLTWV